MPRRRNSRSRAAPRRRCESFPALDAREIARRYGQRCACRWSTAAGLVTAAPGAELSWVDLQVLRVRMHSGEDVLDAETPQVFNLNIERMPSAVGRDRLWFACPKCRRRAGKLFYRRARWACRLCHNLAYTSQSVGPLVRASERLAELMDLQNGRPKHMHQKTYERGLQELAELQDELRETGLRSAHRDIGVKVRTDWLTERNPPGLSLDDAWRAWQG